MFKPSLNDAWLSGFTDAEGTFNVNITKRENTVTGYRVQLRYILDKKNALDLIYLVIFLRYLVMGKWLHEVQTCTDTIAIRL